MKNDSAFLIVKTFPKLYRDYVSRYNNQKEFYAIPRMDKDPKDSKIKYHGVDRDALSPLSGTSNDIKYVPNPLLAELRLDEIEKENRSIGSYILNQSDALEVYNFLEHKDDYEIIWVKIAGSTAKPPAGFTSLGFEPSYFFPEAFSVFSPSCDCMLIPRWHGTDKEGKLFIAFFKQLNLFGLFNSTNEARKFLEYYLSFDWTETGEYQIVEVFIKDSEF